MKNRHRLPKAAAHGCFFLSLLLLAWGSPASAQTGFLGDWIGSGTINDFTVPKPESCTRLRFSFVAEKNLLTFSFVWDGCTNGLRLSSKEEYDIKGDELWAWGQKLGTWSPDGFEILLRSGIENDDGTVQAEDVATKVSVDQNGNLNWERVDSFGGQKLTSRASLRPR